MTARLLTRVALLALAVVVIAAPLAPSASGKPRVSLMTVESQYMCTSCREPLELAQSPQAQSEKQYLAGLVNQGLTPKQIQAQMVAQYGVAVLGKPPANGFNLTVYILPPAIVVLGALGLLYALPKWRERARRAHAQEPDAQPPLAPEDAQRLDDDLARFI